MRTSDVDKARAGWGLLLLTRPRTAARLLKGPEVPSRRELGVLRVLGLRHVVQAAVTEARPTPDVMVAGAGLDVVHALTAVGYALSRRSRRRPGLLGAVIATGFATATMVATPLEPQDTAEPGPSTKAGSDRRATLTVGGAIALGAGGLWLGSRAAARRAASKAPSESGPGTLRYRVPDHQDPAVLVGALSNVGFACTPDWVAGANYLTISCGDLQMDRQRVRSVIERTHESTFTGGDIIHVPVRFEDETAHHAV